MSEEQKPQEPKSQEPKPQEPPVVQRRYKEWDHSSPQEVAMARKLFFGMMALLVILLGSLIYGALK